MTLYYVYEQKKTDSPFILLLKTTGKNKARKVCDECSAPAHVSKFNKGNYTSPIVHCNKAWEDEYLHSTHWADGFIALGDW